MFVFTFILILVLILIDEWNKRAKVAECKRKYNMDTVTYIKYDISSVKRYKLATVFSTVFAVLGIAPMFSDGGFLVSDSNLGLFIIFFFIGLCVWIPLFIYFLYRTLAGIAYLKRLERYGYEIPRDRCIYDNILEHLPKADSTEHIEEYREHE